MVTTSALLLLQLLEPILAPTPTGPRQESGAYTRVLGLLTVWLIWGSRLEGGGSEGRNLGGQPSLLEGATGASTLACIKELSGGSHEKRP